MNAPAREHCACMSGLTEGQVKLIELRTADLGAVGQLTPDETRGVRLAAGIVYATDAEVGAVYEAGRSWQRQCGGAVTWWATPGAVEEVRAAGIVRDQVPHIEIERLLAAGACAAIAESVVRRAVDALAQVLTEPGSHDLTHRPKGVRHVR